MLLPATTRVHSAWCLTAQDNNSVPTALSNANIRITKNANGTINLAIDDFAFGGMVVGDIFVSNVPMKDGKIEKDAPHHPHDRL